MKSNNIKTIKSIISVCLCALTVILSFCSCSVSNNGLDENLENTVQAEKVGKGKRIDLKDYVTVDYISEVTTVETVYSTLAEPVLTVDYDALKESIDTKKAIKFCKETLLMDDASAELYISTFSVEEFFTIRFKEEYRFLANGDLMVIEALPSSQFEYYEIDIADIANGLGISFEKESQIEVSGLALAKELDLFVGIENIVHFKGRNGTGEIYFEVPEDYSVKIDDFYLKKNEHKKDEITIIRNGEYICSYSFYSDTYTENNRTMTRKDWSKGETVTLRASTGSGYRFDYTLAELGYVAKSYEYKGIVVPDLGTAITTANQLDTNDIEQIKKAVYDKVSENNKNVEIISAYFGTIKPDEIYSEADKYYIAVIFSGSVYGGTKYGHCDSEVIAKYDSGELNIEFKPGYLYDKTAEQTEEKLSDKYTYEKLF